MLLPRSVIWDLQGVQSLSHRERGIARYITEQAKAFLAEDPSPIHSLVINPQLGLVSGLEPFLDTGLLTWSRASGPGGVGLEDPDSIFYLTSPFELARPMGELWPRFARKPGVKTAVTLYDLIPLIFADRYLVDDTTRQRYEARLELVRHADLVLSISEATAQDAIDRLDIDRERVVNLGTGVSEIFEPAADPKAVLKAVRAVFPDLRPGYIFYTGGIDFRKNMEGLLQAYAALEPKLRQQHQLVITCRMLPNEEEELVDATRRLSIKGDVLFTNFVDDAVLVGLYQAAHLFVFPSLYEGFGLPVAEALACGTPTVTSSVGSMAEILPDPDLQFNPWEPDSIAASMERMLGDDDLRARSAGFRSRVTSDFNWDTVGTRTRQALGKLAATSGRAPGSKPRRPRVALLSPMPPQQSGIADYTSRLLPYLVRHSDIDVFVDGSPPTFNRIDLDGVRMLPQSSFSSLDDLGMYDEVLFMMGNSGFHGYIYDTLVRRRGVVLAHEVRFTGFYSWYANQSGRGADWFLYQLRDQHPEVPQGLGVDGWLSAEDAQAEGLFMTTELINLSKKFIVHSDYAAAIARLCAPDNQGRVQVVPFGFPGGRKAPDPQSGHKIVASFGIAAAVKRTELFIEAAALVLAEDAGVEFALIGGIDGPYRQKVEALAEELGVADALTITDWIDKEQYEDWLSRVSCAVQLRAQPNGENSAAIADVLSGGVPLIASEVGANRELPRSGFIPIGEPTTPASVARSIMTVLSDPAGAAEMAGRGRSYAEEHDFELSANALWDALQL